MRDFMYSVGQIISTYRKKEKLTQPQLAKKLADDKIHLSYKTISTWEKNISEPNVTTFLHVCRLLNIPDVIEEYFGGNKNDPLAQLNEIGKGKVMDYISLLISSGDAYIKKDNIIPYSSKIRTLRLYSNMVSAGTGNFLDSDDYTEIEVGDEIPQSADFGIRISGDSMEPEIMDNDIVLIDQGKRDVTPGRLYAIGFDEAIYLKRIDILPGKVILKSTNAAYPPVELDTRGDCEDAFRVIGRVLWCGREYK